MSAQTTRERIEEAAKANGYEAIRFYENLDYLITYQRKTRYVRVQYALGTDAVVTATTHKQNIIGKGKAERVIEFLNGAVRV